jgi:hypothetical protein
MTQQLAQNIEIPGPSGTPIPINGPLDPVKFASLGSLITNLLPVLFSMAGLILFLMLIAGGYQMLTAAGDPGKIGKGRTIITNAFIGFFLLLAAWSLSALITWIFGLPGL